MKYDVIVIGGGPAGLAAAIECRKNGVRKILVLERDRELGGILQQCIHNGFGLKVFKEELTGPEYAERFITELKDMDIEYKLDTMVTEIHDDRRILAMNPRDGLLELEAEAVILAMGCRERTRGALAIPGTRPSGVFTAGAAQRLLNMEGYMVGKKVVILGSGDIGLIMARRMTLEGAEVQAVTEIMPFSSGLARNKVQCLDDYGIPLLLSHTVKEIKGNKRVSSVVIAEVDGNRCPVPGTEKEYSCDTLLLSVGLIPENELTRSAGIEIDPATKGPLVNESMETSVPGIFACGNVVHVHDLVDFVTEESRRAGFYAARYVKGSSCLSVDGGHRIKTRAMEGVSYVVTQSIRENHLSDSLNLFLRVRNVYRNSSLLLKGDGELIKKYRKRILSPGEMQHLVVDSELIKGKNYRELTLEVAKEAV